MCIYNSIEIFVINMYICIKVALCFIEVINIVSLEYASKYRKLVSLLPFQMIKAKFRDV